ncbi:Ferredoxin-NADP reductase [Prauserella marina]|uniref:Ferredoxin-NADP reductase n=1 Tax=Prauserella marina TaxID=530584 RepID=A0A1G6P2Q9_9PSEU|nr:PDR/VanB family oxidoreductase [Prauserella marina]PWV82676.1 ferredoxin-NADP reductase [Prauserella marina]SDC74472.1 Ferredoxin-NADP reductase [Prauserella marina]
MSEFELVLARREPVAEDVLRLTLVTESGDPVPAWEPGAHIDLLLADGLERQYSLCGDPADRSALMVAVLREPSGRGGSAFVHDRLTEGTKVPARGPRNNFALAPASRYLFIAGGIGITPLLPMVAEADARGAEWRLVYGGRRRASMAFADDLAAKYGDRVEVYPEDETGLLPLPRLLGAPVAETAVYCCGPEPLLAAAELGCASWEPGTLHIERFSPRTDLGTGPARSFEVELAVSGRTLTVPESKSILEVVEAAGIPVLSSCQEGTCGTCETEVLDGVPEHRDSLLTDEERAAGETMMICVSRSSGPRLVLEL